MILMTTNNTVVIILDGYIGHRRMWHTDKKKEVNDVDNNDDPV